MEESPSPKKDIYNNNSIRIESNQSNSSIRKNCSFHMDEGVAHSFRLFARRYPKKTLAELIELALIEFMENHPLEDVLIVIQQKFVEEIDTVQDRIEQKIICKELRFCMDTLDRIEETGRGDSDAFQDRLVTCLGQAIKIKNPNDTLIALMEKIDSDGYIQ